ncbi:hypothetical protein UPYG_G00303570 [Umbra pygmaea]|uniref:Macrophage mannose receptor 1-like n=1 Tax=Umbra pygmaea TaxID=75934 RepID=A0ABD0WB64_UMBPY
MRSFMITSSVLFLFLQSILGAPETDGPFVLHNEDSHSCLGPCDPGALRWVSAGRLYYTKEKKCLGVSGKMEGSSVIHYDCDEKSDLQQWECHNNTLLTLKGQKLYLHINADSKLVLSKDTGPRSHWVIYGTTEGPCTKTHRELFTIDGNAFGRPCQFPFRYNDQWYGDCTLTDSSIKRLWCAIETNYQDNELWGYCPTTSTDHWHKNPVTGSFYQVNLQSALTWHQARTSCQQQGANLVSITEPHEQIYISSFFGKVDVKVWTGLNSLEEDSFWQWSSGKPLRYFHWDSGHPLSDPGQVCGLMDSSQQSFWQSSLCSKKLGYICQKDPPTAPTVHPEEAGFCSHPWIHYAGMCYRIERTKKKWKEAKTECRKDEGDLASIHNIEQQSFVMSQLGYVATDELWIGLNDIRTSLLFDWSDQSAVTFTRWDASEPAGGNCVLVRGEMARWATQVCEKEFGFLCMKKSSSKSSGPEVDTNPGCKPHWTRYGSYCYFVGQETKTFSEANEICRSLHSYLVDVSSGVDNAFLISLVGSRPEKHFWIGLSNQKHVDIFTWNNGNRVKFTHWNAQMPGSRQGCVAMTTGTLAGLWDVLSCTNQEKYICKHLAEGAMTTVEPTTPVPPSCPENWFPVKSRNYCFKFFTESQTEKKTWYEAREYCKMIGGDLLSIHSAADLNSLDYHVSGNFWIGLSAQEPSSGYTWTDGSPLSFQYWQYGEPNNYNGVESCAEMLMYYDQTVGSWNDADCDANKEWVCELRKGVTPLSPPNNTLPDYNITEDGWVEYEGFQYYFNNAWLSMNDARDYCRQRHGDLAVINGLMENKFLWKQMSITYLEECYIGLTVDLDGTFGWMDGSPVVFQRWDQDQPELKNNDENCVAMTSSNGFWRDINCGTEIPSICKRSGSHPPNSTVAPPPPPTGGCPPDWTRFRSKCYQFIGYRTPVTWLEARSYCQSIRANLASVANREEQVFMTTKMADIEIDLWIGLSSLERDRFVWTDGQGVKYFNWSPNKKLSEIFNFWWGEESDASNQCTAMASSHSILGKWQARSCDDKHGFICQRKVDPGIPIQAPTGFPRNWEKVGNDSYKFLPQNLTWSEAEVQCVTEQSQLASILDELSAAYLELQALKLQTPLWIGLNKNKTQGYFRWIDGWHLRTAQWGYMEPSRDRPCVYLDVDGTWKTAFCNHTYPSVCKQSTAIPPTDPPQFPGECRHLEVKEDEEDEEEDRVVTTWLPFRGHCYSFFIDDLNWPAAATSCHGKAASLVSIEDSAEMSFLQRNLELLKDRNPTFWIGLYRTHLGQWQWLDGTVLDFINWADGHPNTELNYLEFAMMSSSYGTWGTATRWHSRPYICKKPKFLPETQPTAVSPEADQKRARYGLAVVVVLAALCLIGLTAGILYKKTGHPLPTFSKPLVFRAGWKGFKNSFHKESDNADQSAFNNPLYNEPDNKDDMVDVNTVDTNQLVKYMEEEPQPMITL